MFSGHSGPVNVLDGKLLSVQILEKLECHQGPCDCIAIDPTGRNFATGGADALIAIWDVEEMMPLKTLTHLEGRLKGLDYSFDGKYLATASEDKYIGIFSTSIKENNFLDYFEEKKSKSKPPWATFAEFLADHLHSVETEFSCNDVSWHPSKYLLAYSLENRGRDAKDEGLVCVFGAY